MTSGYVELRTRSAFSFLEGATTPEDLVLRAAELGYGAIALGDRDGLYGRPRFHQAATNVGIKPMVGAELTLDDDARLYVLVPDRSRYRNLCRMITDSKLRAAKGQGRITLADLERYWHGMICLAGGTLSPLSRMLARGENPLPLCTRLKATCGRENLYIDLQRHLDASEERLNCKLAALAEAAQVPIVATNYVCHGDAERQLLDVLACIRLKTTLEAAGRALWINNQRHLKPPAEVAALSAPLPAMLPIEETCANYAATGLTAGPHLMTWLRPKLRTRGVLSAADLARARHGTWVRTAGVVIVRQRPATAKGFLFIMLEDETGLSNLIVTPALFQQHRLLLRSVRILFTEGAIQQVDGVMAVRARRFAELTIDGALPPTHDFH